jgi:uncharacterized protein (TIGR01319 family)
MLADSSLQAAIVFAGNEAAQDEVIRLLRSAGKRAVATHNILPDLESLEIEGARKAIAELFLERIVEGKGLSKVRSLCSAEPQATPASVFNLVEALYERTWGTELDLYELRRGFLCLDLGGATTDVYSASQAYAGDAQISCRGIPEGTIQRTVEGDLGLRISAEHTLEQGLHLRSKNSSPLKREALASYVMRIGTDPSYLPRNSEEEDLDAFLAETCIAESLQRHAGSLEAVYTASGLRWIQRGKDLRGIKVLIGTGGRLAQEGSASLISSALGTEWRGTKEGRLEERAKQILIPSLEGLRYYRDSQYILPLVANLVGKHSEIACKIALSSLIEEPIGKEPIGDAP